jgi:parvulin-like peptidyl-prolyl isomerase
MPNQKHINKKHLAHLEVVRRQDRIIRISAIAIIVLVVGIVAYGVLTNSVLLPYRNVATVNGDNITVAEFQTQVKISRIQSINRYMQYMQYAQMFGVQDPANDANFGPVLQKESQLLNSTDAMGQQVIDLLVNDRLIRQEAKKRNITVSADELEKAVQESFSYYANGTPTAVVTPTQIVIPTLNPTQLALVTITPTPSQVPTQTAAPTATLDPSTTPVPTATTGPTETAAPSPTALPTATQVSLDGYKTLLKQRVDGLIKDTGMDEASYRRYIETSLLRDKLLADITKDIKPVQEQVWARHILVKTLEEANAVEARLKKGEDFSKIAKEVSTDTSNKDKGGDLGWFAKGAMVAPFEASAFALSVGQISDPVKSDFGYHVIQVLGHEERPLTDQVFQQLRQTAFTDFLTKLRSTSNVQIFDLWKSIVPTTPALPTSTTGQ